MRVWLLLALLFGLGQVSAQVVVPNHTWEVYVERGVTANGTDRLTFVDMLTGETITTEIAGERYTALGDSVIYYDYVNRRVMTISTDGIPRPHPFMTLPDTAQSIAWVVSDDGRTIAWTITTGAVESLTTLTTVATADGANRREVLVDAGRNGFHAVPVAFNVDKTVLYMDTQPFGVGRFLAYEQYAGLFMVQLDTQTVTALPNEPLCLCGAGFFDQLFLRLGLNGAGTAFDVRLYNLSRKTDVLIPAVNLLGYTQAGDVRVSPDGRYAVYALATVTGFGTPQQTIETVFVLVNLEAMTQTPLSSPTDRYMRPIGWTEDNTAVLLINPQTNGTWKLRLADGVLTQVADASLVGKISVEG